MNQFEHKETQIVKSMLDFSRVSDSFSFSNNASLSIAIAISRDLEHFPSLKSKAVFEFGSENDPISIYVEIVSVFNITHLDKETLKEESETFCRPYIIDELRRKIAELTKLHIGTPLQIPIPNNLEFKKNPPPSGA